METKSMLFKLCVTEHVMVPTLLQELDDELEELDDELDEELEDGSELAIGASRQNQSPSGQQYGVPESHEGLDAGHPDEEDEESDDEDKSIEVHAQASAPATPVPTQMLPCEHSPPHCPGTVTPQPAPDEDDEEVVH